MKTRKAMPMQPIQVTYAGAAPIRLESADISAIASNKLTNLLFEARAKLQEAEQLRRARQLDRAQEICEELIRRYPDYFGAICTLGVIFADKGDFPAAMAKLCHAAMLNPKDCFTFEALSRVYLKLEARVMAARSLEQALRLQPNDARLLAVLGNIYREEREYELAADAFERALKIDPSMGESLIGLGRTMTHLGRPEVAAEALERFVQRESPSVQALYELSQLPASLVKVDILSMVEAIAPGKSKEDADKQSSIALIRARGLARAGRFDESWQHLVAANRLLLPQHSREHGRDRQRREILLASASTTPVLPDEARSLDQQYPLSLMILGPSRSGKTTMERLVGTLDGVKRGYENPIAGNAARQAFQVADMPTTKGMFDLPSALNKFCREFYLEELAERAPSAKVFTNTHPGRIIDVYRMAAILPNMRFIFVKRDLDDISLRIYEKKYREGNHYAYELKSIRDYATWYYRMIDMAAERLPGMCRIIQYEEMIADPEAALKSAAELCGLPAPTVSLPQLGDDRGCAEPYRAFMQDALRS